MRIRSFFALLFGAMLAMGGIAAEDLLVNADLKDGVNGWQKQPVQGAQLDYSTEIGTPVLQIFTNTTLPHSPAWKVTADATKLAAFPADKELEFSFTANTNGDPSVKFRASVIFQKDGKTVTAPASEMTIYTGWEKKSMRFRRPAGTFNQVDVQIELLTAGRLRVSGFQLKEAAPVPVTSNAKTVRDFARVTDFPLRNTYWNTRPESITVEGYAPAATLKITISEIAGKDCGSWNWTVPVREKFTRTLTLPQLAPGAYQVTMISEAGDETLTEVELFRIREGNPQQGVTFNEENFMRLDGKPFFPIGLTHVPINDPDKFRVYAASGINTVCVFELGLSRSWDNYYRHIFTQNDLAIISWDNYPSRYNCGMLERDVKRRAEIFAEFPKFIGLMDDESAWLNSSIKRVREGNAMFFKYAPDYLIWGNNAPRVSTDSAADKRQSFPYLQRYYRTYDVTGIDIYPVPAGKVGHNNLPNQTLSAIGDYTDIAKQIGCNHLPIWMCLQGFGWGEQAGKNNLAQLPRPNYDELRFMVYDSIVHGATGIFWHSEGGKAGHDPTDDVYDEWWTKFADVNRELAVVGQFLASGSRIDLPEPPTGIRWIARANGKDKLLIAVNESAAEKTLQNPLDGTFYASVKGSKAGKTVKVSPYNVVILSTAPMKLAPAKRFTPHPHKFKTGVPCNGEFPLDADYLIGPDVKPGWGAFTARFPLSLPQAPRKACIRITAQREWKLAINGQVADQSAPNFSLPNWFYLFEYDISKYLKAGENNIDVTAWAGYLACEIEIDGQIVARTDETTMISRNGKDNWVKGRSLGRMGTVKGLRVPLRRLSDCR